MCFCCSNVTYIYSLPIKDRKKHFDSSAGVITVGVPDNPVSTKHFRNILLKTSVFPWCDAEKASLCSDEQFDFWHFKTGEATQASDELIKSTWI